MASSRSERDALIRRLVVEFEMVDSEIAKILGCSRRTVGNARNKMTLPSPHNRRQESREPKENEAGLYYAMSRRIGGDLIQLYKTNPKKFHEIRMEMREDLGVQGWLNHFFWVDRAIAEGLK